MSRRQERVNKQDLRALVEASADLERQDVRKLEEGELDNVSGAMPSIGIGIIGFFPTTPPDQQIL